MSLSFIIVTNGQKKAELRAQIQSILNQRISEFEIIVVGDCDQSLLQKGPIVYLPAKDLTDKKLLGALRNKACLQASYENLVISDDDMLFAADWYERFKKNTNFQILTSKVRLPDGGRFWDHACYQSPTNGHQILNSSQNDESLYMSGGQSWVMKRAVFEKVKWGEQFDMAGGEHSMSNLEDYNAGKHNEDTDFAEQCRKAGFTITHDHSLEVWHNDNTYTTVGRYTRRRENGRTSDWVKQMDFNFPTITLINISQSLFNSGFQAEGLDFIRHAASLNFKNPELQNIEQQMNDLNGGALDDVSFDADTCEDYRHLLKTLDL